MHMSRKKILIAIIAVLVVAAGWIFISLKRNIENGALQASGTIEAVEIQISSELAGRVMAVAVEEGDRVSEGQLLFSLNDELLQAQRDRAVAALQTAEDGQALALAGIESAEAALEAARINAEAGKSSTAAALLPLEQGLQALYDNAEVARAKAENDVAAANRLVRETTYLHDNFTVPSGQQNFTASEAIAATKLKLDQARKNFEPYKYEDSSNATRQDLKEALDQTQADYDAAVRRMEYETAVAQAQAALERAEQELKSLENGPDPDQVALYEARIAAAEAQLDQIDALVVQAETGLAQAQARLAQAISQIDQVKAELSQIDIQLKKLTIYAPSAGTVISRNIERGEFIQPGAEALVIGQLDELMITVYLPEDRFGEIKLGMKADVRVDSFPDETFSASVNRIADKAEYTPRNVQTEDGRRTTVFAIMLGIDNPDQALKPGMPADVFFDPESR